VVGEPLLMVELAPPPEPSEPPADVAPSVELFDDDASVVIELLWAATLLAL
jgi:hypothetical protein